MAIAVVNSARGENFGGGEDTTISSSSSFPNTAGNVIIAPYRFQDNDGTKLVTGTGDTPSNFYVRLGSPFRASGTTELDFWMALNIGGHAGNTVTGTFSNGVAYRAVLPVQLSGFPTTGSPTDLYYAAGRATGEGTGSPLSIGPIDAPAGSLVIAVASIDSTGVTWTAGTVGGNAMTKQQEDAFSSVVVQYYVVGGTPISGGNVTIQCSDTSTLKYMLAVVVQESAGGGGGGDQPISKRWGGVPHMGTTKLRGGVTGGVW